MFSERTIRRGLISIALVGLAAGLVAALAGRAGWADMIWAAGTLPVVIALAASIVRDFLAGRIGVDAVAFVSMTAALALWQPLAGVVVAVMYAGGNVLEDFAVARAERDLQIAGRSRAARRPSPHRRLGRGYFRRGGGDRRRDPGARRRGHSGRRRIDVVDCGARRVGADRRADPGRPAATAKPVSSGTLNAGETFEFKATATAGESTYAGIVRMVTAAQTAKAPFIRLADRYALMLLPVTLVVAGAAWFFSGDPIRALAVLVAATPCPLILAAPVAFIAGVSQAARRGILIKGGGPLEALARAHTVMFDKTGTLTVGGARLVAIETAPGEAADEVLRLAGSLEQASHHVVAAAIVATAPGQGLEAADARTGARDSGLRARRRHRWTHGLRRLAVAGVRRTPLDDWAVRALRRASWRSALSVFVAVDGRPIGALLLADELRRETPRAVQALRAAGVARIVMVTGDRADAAETIGAALDLDAVLADRVPADKVDAVGDRAAAASDRDGRRRHQRCAGAGGRRCRHRHGRARRQRLVGGRRRGHPRRPARSRLRGRRRSPGGRAASPCRASSPGWRCPGWPWSRPPSAG